MAGSAAEARSRMAKALREIITDDEEREQILYAPPHPDVDHRMRAPCIPARPLRTTSVSWSEPEEYTDAERALIREATRKDAEESLMEEHYPQASLKKYRRCANKAGTYPKATIRYQNQRRHHEHCLENGLEYTFQMAEPAPRNGSTREQQAKALCANKKYLEEGFGGMELPKAPKRKHVPDKWHSRDGPSHLDFMPGVIMESNVRQPLVENIMPAEHDVELIAEAQPRLPASPWMVQHESAARQRYEEDRAEFATASRLEPGSAAKRVATSTSRTRMLLRSSAR